MDRLTSTWGARVMTKQRTARPLLVVAALTPLAGCAMFPGPTALSDRECMTRVMYFESNRSSEDGMLAVGTTVMNRLNSRRYPKTVCGVVGQPNQFADGVLSKPMSRRDSERVARVADAVLAGERHPQVGSAMFFHTAGLTFPYSNMHYVAVAGGNAFYEKRTEPEPSTIPPALAASTLLAGTTKVPRSIDDLLIGRATPPERQGTMASASVPFSDSGLY